MGLLISYVANVANVTNVRPSKSPLKGDFSFYDFGGEFVEGGEGAPAELLCGKAVGFEVVHDPPCPSRPSKSPLKGDFLFSPFKGELEGVKSHVSMV